MLVVDGGEPMLKLHSLVKLFVHVHGCMVCLQVELVPVRYDKGASARRGGR